MFAKVLKRSTISTAVLGTLGLVVSSGAVVSAPITNVACDYPPSVVTTTTLTLSRSLARYGARTTATAKVSSGSGTPTGTVRFVVDGTGHTANLSGGTARITLPRRLAAQRTHKIVARYRPGTCSTFEAGHSSAKYYSVKKASTVTSVAAPSIRKGQRPVVSTRVVSRTGLRGVGHVVIKLIFNHQVKSRRTVKLRKGAAHYTFPRATKRGRWTAKVSYLGNTNFKGSTARKTFRVK